MPKYRTTFSVDEVARLLKRSADSIRHDIETGVFRLQFKPPEHRRGADPVYQITLRDLEGYIGREQVEELLQPGRQARTERKVESVLVGNHKQCRTCGQKLPLTAFKRDPRSLDGLSGECRACTAKFSD